jgi:hypothetical protein
MNGSVPGVGVGGVGGVDTATATTAPSSNFNVLTPGRNDVNNRNSSATFNMAGLSAFDNHYRASISGPPIAATTATAPKRESRNILTGYSYPPNIQIQPITPPSPSVQYGSEYMYSESTPPISPIISHSSYPSEYAYTPHHYQVAQVQAAGAFLSRDPRTWSVEEVAEWLHSKNIAYYIIEIFTKEGITGRSLFYLSSEDMSAIGVRLFGERVDLQVLIGQLKAERGITEGSEVGVVNASPRNSMMVMMEEGKGPRSTYAPPLYGNY